MLNIGGVANVTWLGRGDDDVLAFDTGPGNALIDDWVLSHTGRGFDADGALAASGTIDQDVLARLLSIRLFRASPPRSRSTATPSTRRRSRPLSAADGAATLTAFTAAAVARSAGTAAGTARPLAGHGRRPAATAS